MNYRSRTYVFCLPLILMLMLLPFWLAGCGAPVGQQIDVHQGMAENQPFLLETRSETKQEEMDFEIQNQDDSSLLAGVTSVQQEGKKGLKSVSYRLVIVNGKEIKRQVVNETVITPPVPQIVLTGTAAAPSSSPVAPQPGRPIIVHPPMMCPDGTIVNHGDPCP